MDEVTGPELRSSIGEVLARVERGESLTVTRDGQPVGLLIPVPRPRLTREALLSRWLHLPVVDGLRLRVGVDGLLDADP